MFEFLDALSWRGLEEVVEFVEAVEGVGNPEDEFQRGSAGVLEALERGGRDAGACSQGGAGPAFEETKSPGAVGEGSGVFFGGEEGQVHGCIVTPISGIVNMISFYTLSSISRQYYIR